MIGHDAWFYHMHTIFHWVSRCCDFSLRHPETPGRVGSHFHAAAQNKTLFKWAHQLHHTHGSDVTALGNAFGDSADIGLCFVAYHGLLVLYFWSQPQWNLAALVLYIAVEVGVPHIPAGGDISVFQLSCPKALPCYLLCAVPVCSSFVMYNGMNSEHLTCCFLLRSSGTWVL